MTDTILYHRARPLLRSLDLSSVPVSAVASQWLAVQAMLKTEEGNVKTKPENDALWFYLMNHAMAEVSQQFEDYEPLGDFEKTVNDYHDMMQVKSLRMFFYLLMITTRESRHAHVTTSMDDLYKEYPEVEAFHHSILNHNEMSAVSKLTDHPPEMLLGRYCEFIERQFTKGGYGGSFGGQAWANVAKCLSDFVHGKITAEMMMDTAFTLCHNNGPIFNKGMVYHGYDASEIRKILDVQRSGQIPQLIAENGSTQVSIAMRTFQKEFEKLVPSFGGYVDWYAVEALGALGHYQSQKNAQDAKYGKPTKLAHADKLAEMKKKAENLKKQKAHKKFMATHLEIMPDVFVQKVKRKAA